MTQEITVTFYQTLNFQIFLSIFCSKNYNRKQNHLITAINNTNNK